MKPSRKKRKRIPSGCRRNVIKRDGGKCQNCGTKENLTIDHVIPISKGGNQKAKNNMQVLCKKCNGDKGDKIPPEYIIKRIEQLKKEKSYLRI